MSSLPSKEELLAFQARWMKPAGWAAVVGALIFAAGIVLQQTGLERTNNDRDQLQLFHDHTTKLIAGQSLQSLGFLCLTPLIYVLFRAASGRAARMRNAFLPIALIGPPLFFVSTLLVSFGISAVADDFVEQKPAVEQQARVDYAKQYGPGSAAQKGVAGKEATSSEATTTTQATTATGSTTSGTTTTATQSKPPTESQFVDIRVEDKAEDLGNHSTAVQVGSGLRFSSTLALLFAFIYTPLWTMRTGLLSRLWGTTGLALGASLILVGLFGLIGLVFWCAVIGLMLAGRWPRPLPPAWAAGEAIPWPKPGEDLGPPPPRPSGDTVEGSGREVPETPLPENGQGDLPADEPPFGETQGQRRKKRKRRR